MADRTLKEGLDPLRILCGPRVGSGPVEISIRNGRELITTEIDPTDPGSWVDLARSLEVAGAVTSQQAVLNLIARAVGYRDPKSDRTFPLSSLPAVVLDLVQLGEAMGHRPEFYALPALAVASGAIGRSVRVHVAGPWYEPAMLWIAVAARVGSGKSPGLRAASARLRRADMQLLEAYRRECQQFEEDERAREQRKGKRYDGDPAEPAKATPPTVPMLLADDITMEALGRRMSENPRGMAALHDEFSEFVMGMNRYRGGRGGDRARFSRIWGEEAIKVDRAKDLDHPIIVPHPYLAIYGAVPSKVLPALIGQEDEAHDGFWARFLLAVIDDVGRGERSDDSRESSEIWDQVIGSLLLLEHEPPLVLQMDRRAQALFDDYDRQLQERNSKEDLPSHAEEFVAKSAGHLARLALVIHVIERAGNLPALLRDRIDVGDVERAWALLSWFIALRLPLEDPQAPGLGAERFADPPADKVMAYLSRHPQITRLTASLLLSMRIENIRTMEDADRVMRRLIERGDVLEGQPTRQGGRSILRLDV